MDMFNFLKGGKVNLDVAVDRPSGIYFPGETVHVKISLNSDKDLKFQEARAALLYQEKYQIRTTHRTTDSHGHSHTEDVLRWQTNDQEVARQVLLGETNLPKGSAQSFEFEAHIPTSAPPSCPGNIIQVKWLAKATLDRKLVGDINAEVPLTVLVCPASARTPATVGQSNEPDDALLSLDLPGTEWAAGETIEGKFLINPQKNFDVTEVRVELEQTESIPYDRGNQKVSAIQLKLAGKTKLMAGQAMVLPFQLQVPQPCSPTGFTGNWSVTWRLKGILARFMRKDTAVEAELKVFSSRPL
jgi:hypothetical protein